MTTYFLRKSRFAKILYSNFSSVWGTDLVKNFIAAAIMASVESWIHYLKLNNTSKNSQNLDGEQTLNANISETDKNSVTH